MKSNMTDVSYAAVGLLRNFSDSGGNLSETTARPAFSSEVDAPADSIQQESIGLDVEIENSLIHHASKPGSNHAILPRPCLQNENRP